MKYRKPYKKLSDLRNTYPVSGSGVVNYHEQFTSDSTSIKYTGKYPENFIVFESIPNYAVNLNTISTVNSEKLRFIVQLIDGTSVDEWTSTSFQKSLEEAKANNNPYFNKGRVTVAQIDYGKLKDYHNVFAEKEVYAQVTVKSTIQSKEDIIKHIIWMVDGGENDEIRTASDFGSWEVNRPIQVGVEFITGSVQQPIESDRVNSTIDDLVKIDYSPFGIPGRFNGDERHIGEGSTYRWTSTNWQTR